MPFAIIRTSKLTSFGNVASSAAHNFRERKTLNADPARTSENITKGAQSVKEIKSSLKDRLKAVPTVRKNAVLAIEYFIGASPEWFIEQSAKTREAYFDDAEKWLVARHGAENVIAFTRQYDETSPHVCAYVVPVDPKGRLNCSHFLDGGAKMTAMQTEFAEKVGERFGLQRGIEGSDAKHVTIKQFYAKIQAPTPHLKTKIPKVEEATISEKMAETVGIATSHSKAVERQKAAKEALSNEYKAMRDVEQAKAKQYDIETAGNKLRDAQLLKLRATATHARDLPLESVLEHLGCTRDPSDKKNWRTPAGRVTVDGAKFYAHDQAKGGGGAIDLVMMIDEVDYKGAVNRLAQDFGTGAVLAQAVATLTPIIKAAAVAAPEPYRAPEPRPENWPKVRQYLTEARRLSCQLVDRLNELGKVYADRYSNAVFVLGKGVGVELRGTGEKPFHGVRGEKKSFIMSDRGEKKVAFVESSIDAMSLWELGFKGRIVSMSGNSAALAKEKAAIYREQGLTVVAAFDNDRAGEQMAANLGRPSERIYPKGKDWNDELRAARPTAAESAARLVQDKDRHQEVKPVRSGPSIEH